MSKLRDLRKNNIFNLFASKIFNLYGIKKKKIKGKNNKVIYSGAYLLNVKIEIYGDNNFIELGNLVGLKNSRILVRGSGHKLVIGKGSHLANSILSFTQDSGTIVIGDDTTVGGASILCGESRTISIGNDCMFSGNIDIRTTDSHSIISLETNKRINISGNVKVGNHVWLGNSCKLWKDSEVGDNSIIGYGSMVTKKIGDNCLAVGTPASVIKENVTWDRYLV